MDAARGPHRAALGQSGPTQTSHILHTSVYVCLCALAGQVVEVVISPGSGQLLFTQGLTVRPPRSGASDGDDAQGRIRS